MQFIQHIVRKFPLQIVISQLVAITCLCFDDPPATEVAATGAPPTVKCGSSSRARNSLGRPF